MRFGKHKAIAVAVAVIVVTAAAVAAWLDEVAVLLLLVIVVQLAGFVALGQMVVDARRRTERRLQQIESSTANEIKAAIAGEAFLEHLRSAALPQQHADQLLRTIEARHVRLEAVLDQLAEKLDRTTAQEDT